MKKLDPEEVKGIQTENRFMRIACTSSLVQGVRRSSNQMDRCGLDVIVYLKGDSKIIKIPVQVKSSSRNIRRYRQIHADLIKVGIIIAILREDDTDEEFRHALEQCFRQIIREKMSFDALFSLIKEKKSVRVPPPPDGLRHNWRRRAILDQARFEEDRTQIMYGFD